MISIPDIPGKPKENVRLSKGQDVSYSLGNKLGRFQR